MATPPQNTLGSSTEKTVARRLVRIEALLFEVQFTLERHVKRVGQLQSQLDDLGHNTREALKKSAAASRKAAPARPRHDGGTAADTLAAAVHTASDAEGGQRAQRAMVARTPQKDRLAPAKRSAARATHR